MRLKAIALSMMLLASSASAYAAIGQGSCPNVAIPANEQTLEVLDNTPNGQVFQISGQFELTNTGSRKARVTLFIRKSPTVTVERHMTIYRGDTVQFPYMFSEDQAFFEVTISSTQPLTCDGSDYTVTP